MVNIKTLIFIPATLMTTAVMASSSASASQVTELEASASAALADMAMEAEIPLNVVLEKMEKLDTVKAADFDDLGDFVTSVLYPLGFGQLCDTLLNVSANLGYILDLNTRNGVQCSAENRNVINSATSCKAADDLTGFVNSVLWPLAIRGFKDTAEKINAQASCLKKILTGQ
ncbi:unnamed protein product [Mucor circinelloides]|uniref:Uncharacterized protein n=1 Tax=Mucor circinelloides f. circinelloides (strain 1006PhL) TaxID=1220926 RepID=S2JDQ3_MUCC1|nr:hypothetical protein HMPREF1544_05220 [Mucor circinelloides 1006PhL]KAG1099847.1 hypothetical protein G6F42_017764 [Rhizopus arrhizus]